MKRKNVGLYPAFGWVGSLRVRAVVYIVIAGGGLAMTSQVLAATYSMNEPHTLTLTIGQGVTVSHTLSAADGLTDSSVPQDKVMATGSFGEDSSLYGFRWTNRDGACGASLACSRIKSTENASDYVDMIASFPAPGDTTSHAFDGYVVVDLGGAKNGTYTLRHMTDAPVKAGTYHVSTEIGVYTP